MDLWGRLATFLLRLIENYDDQAIFLLVFLEECGVPLPLPGDLYMLLAGYRVAQGKMHLAWALFLIEAASLLGASVLYWLAARGGRPLLYRYGRYVNLDRGKLDRAEGWLRRRGALAIVLGRLIPGLRMPTVIAAGVFGVPLRTFLPAFTVGSFIYILVLVLLGMWLGPEALAALGGARVSLRAGATVVLFVALVAFLVVLYRRAAPARKLARAPVAEARRLETSALAGLLATLQMALGVNALLYLLSALDAGLPERTLLRLFEQVAARYTDGWSLRFFALFLTVVCLANLAWAVVYSHVAMSRLPVPAWIGGLVFSLVPLAFSTLVVMPAVGVGPLGLGLGAGLVPLVGEIVRNALFGVGLAGSYSLLRLARHRPLAVPATA